MVELTAAEAGRLANVPARTVQAWKRQGLVEPTVPVPPITPEFVYGFADLMALRFANALRKANAPTWLFERALGEFCGEQLAFRQLVGTDHELWAVCPVEAELGELTLREFDAVLRFLPTEALAGLPNIDPPIHLEFPCHEVAEEIDEALAGWFQSRGSMRPGWC